MIETERLILRRFSANDLLDLSEYLSDPEVVKFEPYRPMSLEEVREELKLRIASDEMIAVKLKSDRKLIGNVYLGERGNHALEIGFVFKHIVPLHKFFIIKNSPESVRVVLGPGFLTFIPI
jgi:RimJ/RimL family protein N-acetyltransferase